MKTKRKIMSLTPVILESSNKKRRISKSSVSTTEIESVDDHWLQHEDSQEKNVNGEEDEEEDDYIIGYNNIKFPRDMRFVPNIKYFLISDHDLQKHPRYYSIERRFGYTDGYSNLKELIKNGEEVPMNLWPIVPQRTKAWFGIRSRGFLSGSTVASFIGLTLPEYGKLLKLSKLSMEDSNKDSYDRIRLKEKYVRKKPSFNGSVFMAWGDHESNAIMTLINTYTNVKVEEWGFKALNPKFLPKSIRNSEYVKKWLPNIGASPDGIVTNFENERWLIEVKCPTPFFPNSKKPMDGFFFKVYVPKIKPKYIAQMYLQSLVWGIDKVLHLIYTVEKTYFFKLYIEEEIMTLLIKIICKSHKKFVTGKEPLGLDKDLRKFIKYCLEVTKEMTESRVSFKSVNNIVENRKYIQTPTRKYKNKV